LDLTDAQDVIISDLCLKGAMLPQSSGDAILLGASDGSPGSYNNIVQGVLIDQFGKNGICIRGAASRNNIIDSCVIRNVLESGVAVFGMAGDAKIKNNFISKTGDHCIVVSG